jgi:hypothetical protein
MKRILAAFFLITAFTACNNESGKPTAAIEGAFTAMKSGNLEEMKKFIAKSDLSMLEAGEKFLMNVDPEGVKKIKDRITKEMSERSNEIDFTLKNEKINGDKATVDAEVRDKNGKTDSHTFELVKEDGAWKIAISKPGNEIFNSMKGNLGPDRNGMKEGLERLQGMNPDSLKMLINKGLQMMDSMDSRKKNP